MQADGNTSLCDLILRDLKAYEILAADLHRNIARYYGCQVRNGLVIGFCMKTLKRSRSKPKLAKGALWQADEPEKAVPQRPFVSTNCCGQYDSQVDREYLATDRRVRQPGKSD